MNKKDLWIPKPHSHVFFCLFYSCALGHFYKKKFLTNIKNFSHEYEKIFLTNKKKVFLTNIKKIFSQRWKKFCHKYKKFFSQYKKIFSQIWKKFSHKYKKKFLPNIKKNFSKI